MAVALQQELSSVPSSKPHPCSYICSFTQEEIDSALHDVAIALEQELTPSPSCSMKLGVLEGGSSNSGSSSPWSLPFQDAMLRQYMCR